jgi:hypothetical protein
MKKNKKEETKERNLFDEVVEGMTALAEARTGKRTLRTDTVASRSTERLVAI